MTKDITEQITTRICRICNSEFTVSYEELSKLMCSPPCAKENARRMNRAAYIEAMADEKKRAYWKNRDKKIYLKNRARILQRSKRKIIKEKQNIISSFLYKMIKDWELQPNKTYHKKFVNKWTNDFIKNEASAAFPRKWPNNAEHDRLTDRK